MIKKIIPVILIMALFIGCPDFPGITDFPGSTTGDQNDEESEGEQEEEQTSEPSSPVFSHSSGDLKALTAVTMSCATPGAFVYYTTDGTTPSSSSTSYDPDSPPRLFGDTVFKAVAVKEGQTSAIATAEFTLIPYYEGVSFSLASGMQWSYTYTHRHSVSYSYFGDSSYTNSYDFKIITGEETEILGIPAYELIVTGGYSLDWKYLATDGYRLYASSDGAALSVIFDAEYGFWIGRGFFADFSDEDALLSVGSVSDDVYEISTSWSYSDDDTAYYPGYGTIYDPDALTMNSSLEESYLNGVGPNYYKKFSSLYDYYEAKSDTYTITFNDLTMGIDTSFYTTDAVISDNLEITLFSSSENYRVQVEISNNYTNYFYFAEGPEGSNLRVSAYSYTDNFEPLFEERDTLATIYESGFLKEPGGDLLLDITGMPSSGGNLKLHVFESGTSASAGQYFSSFSIARTAMLGDGEADESYLDGASYYNRLFRQSSDFGGSCYFYAIPLSANLDVKLALMEDVSMTEFNYSFSGDEFIRFIDENGPGEPETFTRFDDDFAVQIWEDEDGDGASEESGSFLFGWGSY